MTSMEQQDIQNLIVHPEKLDEATLVYLRGVVARYPYFQTAWMLYLKNLFLLGDSNFKDELRRGALFVADLSLLFYYIEGERFSIKKHPSSNECVSTGTDRTLDLIDRFLSDLPAHEISGKDVTEMPVPMEMPGDYTSVLLDEVGCDDKPSSPLHGQELIDQFLEKSETGSMDVQVMSKDEDVESEKGDQLVDSTSVSSVSEAKAESGNSSVEETDVDSEESYFTETLAKIYVRQQRYDKALEIIKKLNLKYPKKNAYFADQIRFLEKLIINAKSK